jgi:hypothetical protein
MKIVDQEIGSYVLTESQKHSAEAAGVILEIHGPQPPPSGDSLMVNSNEEEVNKLEEALRDLNKTAMDSIRLSLI